MEKMAKLEAKYLCSCYKDFDKGQAKLDKKSPGEYYKFSVTKCLDKKRSSKIKDYMDALSEEEKPQFKKMVFENVGKSCPNVRLK